MREPGSRCLLKGCEGFAYSGGPWCLDCAEAFAAEGIRRAQVVHRRRREGRPIATEEHFLREFGAPMSPAERRSYEDWLSELAAVRGEPDPVAAIRARALRQGPPAGDA
jgi:hypothetical protein